MLTDWDERTRALQFRRKHTFNAGSTPSLAEESRPSLKTVDSDLIDRLQASETSASTENDADDSEMTGTGPAGGGEKESSQSAPASSQSTDNGLLWEFGQLVWYLVGQFISGLQSVGRRMLAGGKWVSARLVAENQSGTDGRSLT